MGFGLLLQSAVVHGPLRREGHRHLRRGVARRARQLGAGRGKRSLALGPDRGEGVLVPGLEGSDRGLVRQALRLELPRSLHPRGVRGLF